MTETNRQEQGQDSTATEHGEAKKSERDHINLISHSTMFYWWPVWAVGFVLAGITWFAGQPEDIGRNPPEIIHQSGALGLTYVLVFFAVLLFTNLTLRGLASGIVIVSVMFLIVLFELLGWWDPIIAMIPEVAIYMNFGFYMLTSVLVFILWALCFFVFDRLTYWRVEAGQMTQERLVGGGESSYDTGGLVFEEKHDDPFRHWILGFGTGDIKMTVRGAKTEEFILPNVLFANSKVTKCQKLIKRKPD